MARKAKTPVDASAWTACQTRRRRQVLAGDTVVANIRTDKALIAWAESAGVYVRIDRLTVWGNPYKLAPDGDRATVMNGTANTSMKTRGYSTGWANCVAKSSGVGVTRNSATGVCWPTRLMPVDCQAAPMTTWVLWFLNTTDSPRDHASTLALRTSGFGLMNAPNLATS
jgi:hypothetical protein